MSREYLADEITMIQSDNLVLKQENELLRMTSERKGEENRITREELVELRAMYAEKVDEAAALRTILEGIGHNVSAGLTRFMERRQLRRDRQPQTQATAQERVVTAYREEQRADNGAAAYAPPPRTPPLPQAADAPPAFLRHEKAPRGDVQDHPLLPARGRSTIIPNREEPVHSPSGWPGADQ